MKLTKLLRSNCGGWNRIALGFVVALLLPSASPRMSLAQTPEGYIGLQTFSEATGGSNPYDAGYAVLTTPITLDTTNQYGYGNQIGVGIGYVLGVDPIQSGDEWVLTNQGSFGEFSGQTIGTIGAGSGYNTSNVTGSVDELANLSVSLSGLGSDFLSQLGPGPGYDPSPILSYATLQAASQPVATFGVFNNAIIDINVTSYINSLPLEPGTLASYGQPYFDFGFTMSLVNPPDDGAIAAFDGLTLALVPTPEPSSIVLLGLGAIALAAVARRRMRSAPTGVATTSFQGRTLMQKPLIVFLLATSAATAAPRLAGAGTITFVVPTFNVLYSATQDQTGYFNVGVYETGGNDVLDGFQADLLLNRGPSNFSFINADLNTQVVAGLNGTAYSYAFNPNTGNSYDAAYNISPYVAPNEAFNNDVAVGPGTVLTSIPVGMMRVEYDIPAGTANGSYLLTFNQNNPNNDAAADLVLTGSPNNPQQASPGAVVNGAINVVDPFAGGAQANFGTITSPGDFTSNFLEPATPAALQAAIGAVAAGQIDFQLAGGAAQLWELAYSGTFTGGATVTVHFDPSAIGNTPLSDLYIEHYENGSWVIPSNQVIDQTDDTITFVTDSFSPFVLAATPEPSSAVLLGFGAIGLGAMAIRRSRRRPTAAALAASRFLAARQRSLRAVLWVLVIGASDIALADYLRFDDSQPTGVTATGNGFIGFPLTLNGSLVLTDNTYNNQMLTLPKGADITFSGADSTFSTPFTFSTVYVFLASLTSVSPLSELQLSGTSGGTGEQFTGTFIGTGDPNLPLAIPGGSTIEVLDALGAANILIGSGENTTTFAVVESVPEPPTAFLLLAALPSALLLWAVRLGWWRSRVA